MNYGSTGAISDASVLDVLEVDDDAGHALFKQIEGDALFGDVLPGKVIDHDRVVFERDVRIARVRVRACCSVRVVCHRVALGRASDRFQISLE